MPISLLLLLAAAPPAGIPHTAEAPCATVRAALPPELSAWSRQAPVTAGTAPGEGATLTVGAAARVALHPAQHLRLAPTPAKNGANGGTLQVAVTDPGTYRVALSDGAWIDLVANGAAVASAAHGHGLRCSGVRKLVDYTLAPGIYTIQLSDSAVESVAILMVKLA